MKEVKLEVGKLYIHENSLAMAINDNTTYGIDNSWYRGSNFRPIKQIPVDSLQDIIYRTAYEQRIRQLKEWFLKYEII